VGNTRIVPGASVAPSSILEHPKNMLSTLASTLETQKAEVWEIGLNTYIKDLWVMSKQYNR
jgi:hypothetical protein